MFGPVADARHGEGEGFAIDFLEHRSDFFAVLARDVADVADCERHVLRRRGDHPPGIEDGKARVIAHVHIRPCQFHDMVPRFPIEITMHEPGGHRIEMPGGARRGFGVAHLDPDATGCRGAGHVLDELLELFLLDADDFLAVLEIGHRAVMVDEAEPFALQRESTFRRPAVVYRDIATLEAHVVALLVGYVELQRPRGIAGRRFIEEVHLRRDELQFLRGIGHFRHSCRRLWSEAAVAVRLARRRALPAY